MNNMPAAKNFVDLTSSLASDEDIIISSSSALNNEISPIEWIDLVEEQVSTSVLHDENPMFSRRPTTQKHPPVRPRKLAVPPKEPEQERIIKQAPPLHIQPPPQQKQQREERIADSRFKQNNNLQFGQKRSRPDTWNENRCHKRTREEPFERHYRFPPPSDDLRNSHPSNELRNLHPSNELRNLHQHPYHQRPYPHDDRRPRKERPERPKPTKKKKPPKKKKQKHPQQARDAKIVVNTWLTNVYAASAESLVHAIEELSPIEVKQRLLMALKKDELSMSTNSRGNESTPVADLKETVLTTDQSDNVKRVSDEDLKETPKHLRSDQSLEKSSMDSCADHIRKANNNKDIVDSSREELDIETKKETTNLLEPNSCNELLRKNKANSRKEDCNHLQMFEQTLNEQHQILSAQTNSICSVNSNKLTRQNCASEQGKMEPKHFLSSVSTSSNNPVIIEHIRNNRAELRHGGVGHKDRDEGRLIKGRNQQLKSVYTAVDTQTSSSRAIPPGQDDGKRKMEPKHFMPSMSTSSYNPFIEHTRNDRAEFRHGGVGHKDRDEGRLITSKDRNQQLKSVYTAAGTQTSSSRAILPEQDDDKRKMEPKHFMPSKSTSSYNPFIEHTRNDRAEFRHGEVGHDGTRAITAKDRNRPLKTGNAAVHTQTPSSRAITFGSNETTREKIGPGQHGAKTKRTTPTELKHGIHPVNDYVRNNKSGARNEDGGRNTRLEGEGHPVEATRVTNMTQTASSCARKIDSSETAGRNSEIGKDNTKLNKTTSAEPTQTISCTSSNLESEHTRNNQDGSRHSGVGNNHGRRHATLRGWNPSLKSTHTTTDEQTPSSRLGPFDSNGTTRQKGDQEQYVNNTKKAAAVEPNHFMSSAATVINASFTGHVLNDKAVLHSGVEKNDAGNPIMFESKREPLKSIHTTVGTQIRSSRAVTFDSNETNSKGNVSGQYAMESPPPAPETMHSTQSDAISRENPLADHGLSVKARPRQSCIGNNDGRESITLEGKNQPLKSEEMPSSYRKSDPGPCGLATNETTPKPRHSTATVSTSRNNPLTEHTRNTQAGTRHNVGNKDGGRPVILEVKSEPLKSTCTTADRQSLSSHAILINSNEANPKEADYEHCGTKIQESTPQEPMRSMPKTSASSDNPSIERRMKKKAETSLNDVEFVSVSEAPRHIGLKEKKQQPKLIQHATERKTVPSTHAPFSCISIVDFKERTRETIKAYKQDSTKPKEASPVEAKRSLPTGNASRSTPIAAGVFKGGTDLVGCGDDIFCSGFAKTPVESEKMRKQAPSFCDFIIIDDSSDDEDISKVARKKRKPETRKRKRDFQLSRGSRKFDMEKNFNYKFTVADAKEMQERLFAEAAARVRAQSDLVDTDVQTGSPLIFSPVLNVHQRYPDHWKWKDPWACLGLPPNSTLRLVKSQYRSLAKLYHPDKSKDMNTSTKFHNITKAYRRLCATSLCRDL